MPSEKPVRIKLRLLQSKIDRARAALGAASDTEAVDRALDLAIEAGRAGRTPPKAAAPGTKSTGPTGS